jgi:hypothetical protein
VRKLTLGFAAEITKRHEFGRADRAGDAAPSGGFLDPARYTLDIWSAVYPPHKNSLHAFHAHQDSLASCVFYAASEPYSTPLGFVDPRGGSPLQDYERFRA